ncbi:unnamed protein product [Boreogadus saida]
MSSTAWTNVQPRKSTVEALPPASPSGVKWYGRTLQRQPGLKGGGGGEDPPACGKVPGTTSDFQGPNCFPSFHGAPGPGAGATCQGRFLNILGGPAVSEPWPGWDLSAAAHRAVGSSTGRGPCGGLPQYRSAGGGNSLLAPWRRRWIRKTNTSGSSDIELLPGVAL